MSHTRLKYSRFLTCFLVVLCVNFMYFNKILKADQHFVYDQEKKVSILYSRWYSWPLHTLLTTSKWPSVFAGFFANSTLSAFFIPGFVQRYSINTAEIENSLNSFKTFNQFFIRTLKKDARPLCKEKNGVISPADGAVLVIKHIGQTDKFPVKGTTFNLEKLLKNPELAQAFQGGTAFIIRLAPWDYHRLHFPLAGYPQAHKVIHGKFESVQPLVYSSGIQPLEVNERHLIMFETQSASTVALIPVGALFVGAITQSYKPEQYVAQGDEIGYFTFGGSTIVMLFKAGTINVLPEILQNSAAGKETPIKMGQLIATTLNL